jgi:hypothetical protein
MQDQKYQEFCWRCYKSPYLDYRPESFKFKGGGVYQASETGASEVFAALNQG